MIRDNNGPLQILVIGKHGLDCPEFALVDIHIHHLPVFSQPEFVGDHVLQLQILFGDKVDDDTYASGYFSNVSFHTCD
jgi:hypothetical protein